MVTEEKIQVFCDYLLRDIDTLDIVTTQARIHEGMGVLHLLDESEAKTKIANAVKLLYSRKRALLFGYVDEKIPA